MLHHLRRSASRSYSPKSLALEIRSASQLPRLNAQVTDVLHRSEANVKPGPRTLASEASLILDLEKVAGKRRSLKRTFAAAISIKIRCVTRAYNHAGFSYCTSIQTVILGIFLWEQYKIFHRLDIEISSKNGRRSGFAGRKENWELFLFVR